MGISETIAGFFIGGVFGALIVASIVLAVLVFIGLYVYFSYAWYVIARKLNYKYAWLAWIPFANVGMMLQLGGFHWAWVFLLLIPILGWIAIFVLTIIATWKIFELRNYPGWFSLSIVIPQIGGILYLIAIGFVAWSDKENEVKKKEIKGKVVKKKVRKKIK
jgi:hypothetical protein